MLLWKCCAHSATLFLCRLLWDRIIRICGGKKRNKNSAMLSKVSNSYDFARPSSCTTISNCVTAFNLVASRVFSFQWSRFHLDGKSTRCGLSADLRMSNGGLSVDLRWSIVGLLIWLQVFNELQIFVNASSGTRTRVSLPLCRMGRKCSIQTFTLREEIEVDRTKLWQIVTNFERNTVLRAAEGRNGNW